MPGEPARQTEKRNPRAPRTRVVATLGPASRSPDVVARLIRAGVDVFRLNFSHGTHHEHSETLRVVRRASEDLGRHVAVLQDLGGPKIRLGTLPGDLVECPPDALFTLLADRPPDRGDDPRILTCSYRELPRDLKTGETILLADGNVAMRVEQTALGGDPDAALLRVTLPGRLRSRQGLNLPGTELRVPSLTEKDLDDLSWTARQGDDVQFVGMSFVRSAADLVRLRAELRARGSNARVLAKIEKPQAVANLDSIVAEADAVMVARGDLGVEVDAALVPAIQKRIIAKCNAAGVPVVTATQMLDSMERSNRPTRAEASDVFNAVLDGADAVMLSGETAIGAYPVEAVETMRAICEQAERYAASVAPKSPPLPDDDFPPAGLAPITGALVEAARHAAARLDAKLIVVATRSGRTARGLGKLRPTAPILALAQSRDTARALCLGWGVVPVELPKGLGPDEDLDYALAVAAQWELARSGDRVVLLRGKLAGEQAEQALLVREVP